MELLLHRTDPLRALLQLHHLLSCFLFLLPFDVHVIAPSPASATQQHSSVALQSSAAASKDHPQFPLFPNNTYLDRSFFPPHFVFGSLTLAVKHEGASAGKVDSIWDAYAQTSGIVLDSTLPANAGDEYYHYQEDIEAMASMGMDAFRFSLAWTRLLPNRSGSPDTKAIAHYNDLIDKLIDKGIEPHVTLWAEDHPQALEEAYGGLLSPLFIHDFIAYANVCFAEFGDRVKHWITFDEPNDYASLAYASQQSPPGRCTPSAHVMGNCTTGDSSTEPYLVAHHFLLAHSAVAKLYRTNYKAAQGGYIGIALWFKWYEPLNTTDVADLLAAERAQDFYFGWFMDPLVSGTYPQTMQTMLGPRLPSFTEEESNDLRQSLDFLGINAVTATYVMNTSGGAYDGYFQDIGIDMTPYRDGVIIGEGQNEFAVPWCMEKIVDYMRVKYGNPPMYITETGWGITYAPSFDENLNDSERVEYFYAYYSTLSQAIRNGGNVLGVFAWSLIDGFEFFLGLKVRFGLIYVDEDMMRHPRLSAFWHQQLLTSNLTSFNNKLLGTKSEDTKATAISSM